MHRLPIFQDSRSFDERTDRLLRDVRRQIDEDLQSFGFGGKNLLGSSRLNWPSEEDGQSSKLLNKDFFKLRPSTSVSAASLLGRGSDSSDRLSSPPPRKDDLGGSRETLDEETAKGLYVNQPQSDGRLFCMSFDVKDFEAEDISVTVEDDTLLVQAKRRTEKDGAVSVKEFNRKIKLPKDVDPEKLVSTMTSDGILTIEAQVPPDYEAAVATPPPTTPGATSAGATPNLNGSSAGNAAAAGATGAASTPASTIPLDTPVFSSEGSTGRRRMDLVLGVGSPYTPEDISVKLEGRRLLVEAIHEEKFQGRTSKVSMQRDFDLTEDIDVSSVKALLKSSTGQLTITAYAQ